MTLCRFQAWSPYTIKSWIGSSHQGLFACHIGFRFQLLLDNHGMQSSLVVARFTTLSLLLCFRVIYVFACWQKIFDWSRATTVLWLHCIWWYIFTKNKAEQRMKCLQQGNPVLKYIRNLRWVYGEIVPDYILGQTTCALYLRSQFEFPDQDVWLSLFVYSNSTQWL